MLRPSDPWSPIASIADGRRAALSIDRQLQRVSLAASRQDFGGFETGLIVNLKDVESVPPVRAADAASGYSREEATAEAERCLQCECLECVKACTYLEEYGAHPGLYARRIYNNLTVTQGRGSRSANRMIDSCSLCRLCYEVCPTDLDMAEVTHAARREMVRQGRMPASAFDFAVQDLRLAVDERSALARHAPGTDASDAVFFPGCQLAASDPAQVERTYAYLRERYSPATGLLLYCCGAPADWAGQGALFDETLAGLRERLESLGSPRVILACPTCETVFAARLPEVETVSLWEVLRDVGLPDGAAGSGSGRRVAVHDACTARYQTDVQRRDPRARRRLRLRDRRARDVARAHRVLRLRRADAVREPGDGRPGRRSPHPRGRRRLRRLLRHVPRPLRGQRQAHGARPRPPLRRGLRRARPAARAGADAALRAAGAAQGARCSPASGGRAPSPAPTGARNSSSRPRSRTSWSSGASARRRSMQVIAHGQATGHRFVEPSTGHLLASLAIGAVDLLGRVRPRGRSLPRASAPTATAWRSSRRRGRRPTASSPTTAGSGAARSAIMRSSLDQ